MTRTGFRRLLQELRTTEAPARLNQLAYQIRLEIDAPWMDDELQREADDALRAQDARFRALVEGRSGWGGSRRSRARSPSAPTAPATAPATATGGCSRGTARTPEPTPGTTSVLRLTARSAASYQQLRARVGRSLTAHVSGLSYSDLLSARLMSSGLRSAYRWLWRQSPVLSGGPRTRPLPGAQPSPRTET